MKRPPIRSAVLRAGFTRWVGVAGGVILQPWQPSVKHLSEIESQEVMHCKLRAGYHPHLLSQSVYVPDQDLQPDVDRRVENKMKHNRPTSETPLLWVDLLQRKVGQWMHDAKIRRGEAHQFRVPIIQNPLQRWEQDIQSHAVHPVEVKPHPSRNLPQRFWRVLGLSGRFLLAGRF